MKRNKGITLVALVVTIIVLLILASVSINLVLGENGIITRAKKAKIDTEIDGERQNVELVATDLSATKKLDESIRHLTLDMVNDVVDKQIGLDKVTITEKPGPVFEIKYNDSNRKYTIDDDFEVESPKAGIKDKKYFVESEQEFTIADLINEEDVKKEVKNYSSYTVTGISLNENGEVASSQTGESGTFTLETDKGVAKYKLNHFLNNDEVYYVHITINDNIEKVQKVTFKPASVMTYQIEFQGNDREKNIITVASGDSTENVFSSTWEEVIDTTTGWYKSVKDENGLTIGHELISDHKGYFNGNGYVRNNVAGSIIYFVFEGTGFDMSFKAAKDSGAFWILSYEYETNRGKFVNVLDTNSGEDDERLTYLSYVINGKTQVKDKIQGWEFGKYEVCLPISSRQYFDVIKVYK